MSEEGEEPALKGKPDLTGWYFFGGGQGGGKRKVASATRGQLVLKRKSQRGIKGLMERFILWNEKSTPMCGKEGDQRGDGAIYAIRGNETAQSGVKSDIALEEREMIPILSLTDGWFK